jgi:hypothetical protein
VLTDSHLLYYKEESDRKPAGTIVITGAQVAPVLKWRLHLRPTNTNRIYVIAAADEGERDDWVQDLQLAAAGTGAPRSMMDGGAASSISGEGRAKYHTDLQLGDAAKKEGGGSGDSKPKPSRDQRAVQLKDCSDEQLLHEVHVVRRINMEKRITEDLIKKRYRFGRILGKA